MDYDESYPDMDPEIFYDEMYEYMDSEFVPVPTYSLKNLWEDCLIPTLSSGFSAASTIFLCSVILRCTSCLNFLPLVVIHLTSGVTGLYCLHSFFGFEFLYIVIFMFIGYGVLCLHPVLRKYTGITCTIVCFAVLILCELFIVDAAAWHRIRGSQMVLAMKIISLAFDIVNGIQTAPTTVECFGYFFSVGTVIFGPWISYSTYEGLLHQKNGNFSWIIKVIESFSMCLVFLTVSTCWSAWILQGISWKWLEAYRDALSFRSSHYFVSYLSEALAVTSGISSVTGKWSLPVVQPHKIELPRSLVEVVISWNLPMHFWLKTYIFKNARSLGDFCAVLLTYAASSLLHGLNFQLAAVLLSLGFYTYIEYVLRKKLAGTFNACILSRKCKRGCQHTYKSSNLYVFLANFHFSFLAIFHLAYLGVMFDSSSSIQEEGYSMQHTLGKWSHLDFLSHWVALATYVFHVLI